MTRCRTKALTNVGFDSDGGPSPEWKRIVPASIFERCFVPQWSCQLAEALAIISV